jgi:pyrophosphate--fructose-6-phosphate 1-phosphotransferase
MNELNMEVVVPDKTADLVQKLLENPEIQNVVSSVSPVMKARQGYKPSVCSVFDGGATALEFSDAYRFEIDKDARAALPRIIDNRVQVVTPSAKTDRYEKAYQIGIVFSGGPAPGGHNVIAGLYDAAKRANPKSRIFGFLVGPDGIIEGEYIELDDRRVDHYRNLGGFSMIKTGRTKIDTSEKMALSRKTILKMGLDALVVVGGDDSNTNAAFLAQELWQDGIQVIGVPKTIDGDIQVRDADGKVLCAMSFGFHTAARAFSLAISNLCTDCSSDVKYWHICKVMGRVASHLALEVALQTHANLTMIGEDLADYVDVHRLDKAQKEGEVDFTAYGMTLRHLSRLICDAIVRRAAVGKNYGLIVIPEGILEFINEIEVFIVKLNTIIADYNDRHDRGFHNSFPRLEDKLEYLRRLFRDMPKGLAPNVWNARDDDLFNDLPPFFQEGLLTERDSHGNFQFSQVPTEKVLLGLVEEYLDILREQGRYKMGINRTYYHKILSGAGLDADAYGEILFKDYGGSNEYLLIRDSIISVRTLSTALEQAGAIKENETIHSALIKIFKATVPKFKTQTHFYGYDGRGSDPTQFDCTYTYNLGLTVFSLVANGATGQMAAIRNLENEFDQWEPLGIPIAPLMRLEERKGKLTLVLEKSLVDVHAPAFQVVKAHREKWLAAYPGQDQYRCPGQISLDHEHEEDRPITLRINALSRVIAEPPDD